MTSFHRNFDEGFWFATTNARQIINDIYVVSNQVICIDSTIKKVRIHITSLIERINNGWLPNDKELEIPLYDIQ
jgi:hypothetical protein